MMRVRVRIFIINISINNINIILYTSKYAWKIIYFLRTVYYIKYYRG